jgi:hypothetical protein
VPGDLPAAVAKVFDTDSARQPRRRPRRPPKRDDTSPPPYQRPPIDRPAPTLEPNTSGSGTAESPASVQEDDADEFREGEDGSSEEDFPRRGPKKRPHRRYPVRDVVVMESVADPRYVHWCISSRRNACCIQKIRVKTSSGAMPGRGFVSELRRTYYSIRGWGWWFSFLDCAGVKFKKVRRPAIIKDRNLKSSE